MYERICPECGKKLIYKYKSTYEYALNKNSLCNRCGSYKYKKQNANLNILLKDTLETFYWIGFLLADGHFSNKRLKLTLSIKDTEHLKKFGNYINYKGNYHISNVKINNNIYNCIYISIQDIKTIPQIINKFNIASNKTILPPQTILKWDNDLLISLFIGFIDGDGCISKKQNRQDSNIRIKTHNNWYNILNEFNKLIENKGICQINKQNYAILNIEDFVIVKKLKLFALNNNLPILKRKWDKINENYINRNERKIFIRKQIKEDLLQQIPRKIIAEKYNISQSLISKLIKYDKLI